MSYEWRNLPMPTPMSVCIQAATPLSAADLGLLLSLAPLCEGLQSLQLMGSTAYQIMTDEAKSNLAALLHDAAPHWPHLQHLDLYCAHLRHDQTGEVLTAVGQHCRQLKHLDIYGNAVGSRELQALAAFSQLQHLRLTQARSSGRFYDDIQRRRAFVAAAQSWKQLTHLDLSAAGNHASERLYSQGAWILASAGQHWSNLQVLKLRNAWLGANAATALAATAAQWWPQLRHLDLCCNSLETEGAEALAQAGRHFSQLRYLDLSGNRLGPGASESLAAAAHHWTQLQHLDLSSNSLGVAGVQALAAAGPHWTQLQCLRLSDNDAGSSCEALLRAVPHWGREGSVLI
jgi:Ran GTPase-activating protein (RanGAP) involved in mRNA processing and transport